jgi:uncharacterized protein (DUF2147 family)
MHTSKRCILGFIALACLIGPAAAGPVGEWLVADGTARVLIEPCGDALWGIISAADTPGKDENNPDPAKRDRSIIGLPILLNMKMVEANRWDGEVYNAENGKTYTSRIRLVKDDVLRIEGCLLGIFCGGENWTRVIAPQIQPEPLAKQKPAPPAKQKDVCP